MGAVRLVGLPLFPTKAGKLHFQLLSKHLFVLLIIVAQLIFFFGFSGFKWDILSVFLLITASKLATLVPVYHKIAALELANLTTALLVNENFNVDLPEDDLDT